MMTPSRTCHSGDCRTEVPSGFNDGGLCFEHYLQAAMCKLDTSVSRFRDGRGVDRATLEWLIVQVEFVVEAIDNDASSLTGDQKARLLELLLGIANLTEYIRHSAYRVERTH